MGDWQRNMPHLFKRGRDGRRQHVLVLDGHHLADLERRAPHAAESVGEALRIGLRQHAAALPSGGRAKGAGDRVRGCPPHQPRPKPREAGSAAKP